ncbi:MAG: DUF1697 domain-containing protein [Ghiorsea sp.]
MKFISLLRGINVAGHKRIKMADLKALYESLSFNDVQTYIQSGNVIFDAEQDIDHQGMIEQAIQDKYGFEVPVLVKTFEQMEQVFDACPFDSGSGVNGATVLVIFLSKQPRNEDLHQLLAYKVDGESFHANHLEIYLFCPNGYGKTKLSNALLEKKLHVQATTRNWGTVRKLLEMAKE